MNGAGWWRDAVARMRSPLRRRALEGFSLLGSAALAAGCYDVAPGATETELTQSRDELEVGMNAIDLQRREGWNAGSTEQELALAGASPVDASGSAAWSWSMETLAPALVPARPDLQPWYVPTLFQSLAGPTAESLRAEMQPVATPSMARSFARGRALASLFEQAGWPNDVAIVVDTDGADAVAVAAAMADRFEPVFLFDNWPHPNGVVPSQMALGAALYYRPLFERARAARPQPAPPLFVLDANRLAPYADEEGAFDNRYLARMPGADALAALGVRHVLYVTADGQQELELDDLNEPFVGYEQRGIDVKRIALDDFRELAAPVAVAVDGEDAPPVTYTGGWWWGGDPAWHFWFWSWYGWHAPLHPVRCPRPLAPPRVCRGFAFRVAPRMTLPLRGPAGVGHVTVRASRATGGIVHFGRSGSSGRFHGGFGG